MEMTVRKRKTKGYYLSEVSKGQMHPKAVGTHVTSPCMFALTRSHRSQSFCKHTAGHLPWTMNTLGLLPPLEVPMAALFHHLALGHSQAEGKGELTLQAQLTVITCLNCRAGAMPTSWTSPTWYTYTSPFTQLNVQGCILFFYTSATYQTEAVTRPLDKQSAPASTICPCLPQPQRA